MEPSAQLLEMAGPAPEKKAQAQLAELQAVFDTQLTALKTHQQQSEADKDATEEERQKLASQVQQLERERQRQVHLIIKQAYKVLHNKEKLDVLATNSEQFKTFSIGNLKFIDSGAFMQSSLANILDSMTDEQKPRLESISPEHFELVKAKGLFPYE